MKWDPVYADAAIELWGNILFSMVRVYRKNRMKMWERIPNACISNARQFTRIHQWCTAVLRSLQIPNAGNPTDPYSVASSIQTLLVEIREWDEDQPVVERRVLRALTDEISAVVVDAQIKWDQFKRKNSNAIKGD